MRLANSLVGNRPDAAVLEATLHGPVLRFHAAVDLAVTGAETAIPHGRSMSVEAGDVLRFGPVIGGARSYLAFRGGVVCTPTLGSRSTDSHNAIGPRPLAAGDRIELGDAGVEPTGARWSATPEPQPNPGVLRVLPGPHGDPRSLTRHRFEVSAVSDRVGLRLIGGPVRDLPHAQVASLAMVTGAVQVPPDGHPIVLLADHGTTGGYPVVAVVISADIGVLAQLVPGNPVQFDLVTLEQAVEAFVSQQQWLRTAVARLDLL
jgi:biotin-dependent carboxylase-like uncharacterized protein